MEENKIKMDNNVQMLRQYSSMFLARRYLNKIFITSNIFDNDKTLLLQLSKPMMSKPYILHWDGKSSQMNTLVDLSCTIIYVVSLIAIKYVWTLLGLTEIIFSPYSCFVSDKKKFELFRDEICDVSVCSGNVVV